MCTLCCNVDGGCIILHPLYQIITNNLHNPSCNDSNKVSTHYACTFVPYNVYHSDNKQTLIFISDVGIISTPSRLKLKQRLLASIFCTKRNHAI